MHRERRQRIDSAGHYPSLCGGAGPILQQRVRIGPHIQLPSGLLHTGGDDHWRLHHGKFKKIGAKDDTRE